MVGEWNGNAIVVDCLFIDANFQVGEGEDVGTMGGEYPMDCVNLHCSVE